MKVLIALLLLFLFNLDISNAGQYLRLESALKQALENNPEIKAARAHWQAKTKIPSQVSTLPNPTIGVSFKNAGFSEITLGDDPRTDIQAFMIQEIPFPTKLSSKKKIAEENTESYKWETESTSRRVIGDLKEVYYNWFLVTKSLEITEKNKDLLEKFVKTAEIKYEVGKGIQQDVIKAQVELSSFIERIELLKMKKDITEAQLKKIINLPQDSNIGSPEEIKESSLDSSLEQLLVITKKQSPMLLKQLELIDRKEEELNLAKKQYLPDFIVKATYFNRDGGSGDLDDLWQVGVGLKVPLYFWRKEKLGTEEARLNLKASKEGYEDRASEIMFSVKDQYIKARTAARLMGLYSDGIIPQSQISLESAISGYQVGDVDFLTLLNNLVTLFNFEIEYYRQLSQYQTSLARLEQLTGVDLIFNNN
ncbi:MAG: TolC family protein [Candidatus Dadabacteria bacterium]|nr:TolC family protein [Candidatus Dadabacteria bacterium]NIS09931.1 TolC family protein [Candidatus Dadabacteria bacterium]NIV41819.1 TolC family protein [Candidatus Dadabacteria bacterium]NIX16350.1 TolC family protein [Candidatus Dadabacteria bacterium]NIY21399.1 TolC family protein [Candidatus Dadabacteria bacterium]